MKEEEAGGNLLVVMRQEGVEDGNLGSSREQKWEELHTSGWRAEDEWAEAEHGWRGRAGVEGLE